MKLFYWVWGLGMFSAPTVYFVNKLTHWFYFLSLMALAFSIDYLQRGYE